MPTGFAQPSLFDASGSVETRPSGAARLLRFAPVRRPGCDRGRLWTGREGYAEESTAGISAGPPAGFAYGALPKCLRYSRSSTASASSMSALKWSGN